ncbi:MAG: DNA polymerase, partial [Oscillospiraceae bacterium]
PINKIVNDAKSLYRFAYHNQIEIIRLIFCLKLAGYLIYPTAANQYSIESLQNICGILPAKLEGATPELQKQFVENSAVFDTLYLLLDKKIKEYHQEHLLNEIELPLANVLSSMEYDGFALDTQGMRIYGEDLARDILELEKQIYIQAQGEFNINSPKQLGAVLFEKLELPTHKKTKSGYSTNVEVFNFLKDKHPIIELILEYRQLTKLKSTYVDGLLKLVDDKNRIHSIFQQTETRTGRISSTEPNLQNIPVKTQRGSNLRAFFIAKEGSKLVDADYSQIELRVLAHVAKDENMIEAFNSNQDIHTITASQIFDIPPLFVTPQMRGRAKAVNFGIVYGMGAFSLSENIGVSLADAKKYITNYLENFSGVRKYMQTIVETATQDGYVTTEFNRRRYIPELSASNKIVKAQGNRIAMNTPI